MRELSIFIDESGDFGPYDYRAPFYLITLVFHDQTDSIDQQVEHLKRHVCDVGLDAAQAVHAGPLIRREQNFSHLPLDLRRKLFHALFTFVRLCPLTYKTFIFPKREMGEHDAMLSRMAREIGLFVREQLAVFQSFDRVVVYYDNGQKEITNIINSVFNAYIGAEVRRVIPSDYALFQAADLICTVELIAKRLESGLSMSSSEVAFFGNALQFKKRYLRPIRRKRLGI